MKNQRGIVLAASLLLLTGNSVPMQAADPNGSSSTSDSVPAGFVPAGFAAPDSNSTSPKQGKSSSDNPNAVSPQVVPRAGTSPTGLQPSGAAVSGSPAATPSAPAADPSVPDFLKEYAPKPGELIPPPPVAGSTPPAVQVPPAVVRPRPASAPVQSSTTKAPKMLVGRLEEIGGSGAKLPVGVLMKLKIGTAKLDPTVTKPTTVQGVVSSFPVDWQGQWGGQLKVHAAQFDPAAWTFDPEETRLTQKIETPGAMAGTTFNFVQQGAVVSVEPAQLYFAPRRDTANARAMQQQLGPLAGMLGGNSQMLGMMTESIPVMVLGSATGLRGLTGNALESRVIKNDIRQLKPGVLEQNIVVQESEQHRSSGNVQRSLSETVMRFTKLSSSQLYVQAASIKYRNDGHFLNKVLFYGTVNRGQSGAPPGMGAGGLPGMPGLNSGAFPGMSPSGGGMGGLGDLQKMLKQLQGGY